MPEYKIDYEAEIGQNSKGFWYCKNLKVISVDATNLKALLHNGIETVEAELNEANDRAAELNLKKASAKAADSDVKPAKKKREHKVAEDHDKN